MSNQHMFTAEENGIMYRFKLDAFDKTVAEAAYATDKNIEAITIPNSIKNIPVVSVAAGAFAQMKSLKTVCFEPSASITIEKEAFALCPNLEKVESYSDILILHKKVFFNNPSLTKFFCYGKINLKGENIFFQCQNLEKINGRIQELGTHSLSGATGLKKLIFANDAKFYKESFAGCSVSELWFMGNAEFIAPATALIMKEHKILCRHSSNLADLAYEGFNIETSALINICAF